MCRKMKRMLMILLTGVLLIGTAAAPVLAEETAEETVKTITLKKQKFTTKTSTAKKKAKELALGETIVKMPAKGMGYMKFTAPKKGTYKIKFSDLTKKNGTSDGYINLMLPEKGEAKKLVKQKVKTWGGSAYSLWLGLKNKKYKTDKALWTRTSRTAKIKLKKGQVLYIFFRFAAKDTVKVMIAK